MIIRDMFAKPIDRDIKGVIKVGQDDNANVKQELDEYVVTRELQKHFSEFFSSYKKGITGTTDKMGVWISGFFGSGKSHFLKILSYILDNDRVVDGRKAVDYFKDKIKDSMTFADMQLASSTPTDVILFNIDSKSEMSGKQNKDAIVSVFLKVFNEMQGYCGAIPFLADLERKLNESGKYDEFKSKFEQSYGSPWESSRTDFDFIQDDVVEVLADMGFMSEEAGRNWCEKATDEYSISIEDFARLVKKYVDKKGTNHHVVFLVDEIGQYIGDDSKLMLNLQTVTEDLGRFCNGKVWVIVTSQQDIDSITKTKGNDFSKIQGRFDTRLSLSSANVDEVIKKRILEKTETAKQTLELLYDQKATALKNIIVFNDTAEKKLYTDRTDFALIYPFVPYQFNILGSVLTAIRTHGASGKHLSDAERSMLALFKESAVTKMNCEVGTLIPFNLFYDALEEFLDHSHKGVIAKALDNDYLNPEHEADCFDVNVLKTLFMIKYVKEISATVVNITSLMIDSVDTDRIALTKRVEDALARLYRQTLIDKSGDIYIFLTNEEQEINRAIQSQSFELSDVSNKISEIIFDGIYEDKKYRCPRLNNRYSFPINLIVDDRPYKQTQSYNIGLKIITPNYGEVDESMLGIMSMQESNVIVVLPNDRSYIEEIEAALRIERFLRANASSALLNFEQVKVAKSAEMRTHNQNAVLFLSEAMKQAEIYVNGDKVQIPSKEITARINEALGKLVAIVYHKLTYIDTAYGEMDIRKLMKPTNQVRIADDNAGGANQLAVDEVSAFIFNNTQRHAKTSMKSIIDRFSVAPYGFVEDDIEWIVAKLFTGGEVAFYMNNEAITLQSKSDDEIIKYITRREFAERLLTERRDKANTVQIKSVKEVMKAVFNVSSVNDDEDALMVSFKKFAANMKTELEKLEIEYKNNASYPGAKVVKDGIRLMADVSALAYSIEFFRAIDSKRDTFLDFGEDYEPVKAFFVGEQRGIFDKSLKLIAIYEDSKTFITDKNIESAYSEVRAIVRKPSPYSEIHKLPGLNEHFWELYVKLLEDLTVPVNNAIDEARKRVFEELSGKKCKDEFSDRYIRRFDEIRDKAQRCNNVATLQNITIEVDALKVRMLQEIADREHAILEEEAKKAASQQGVTDTPAVPQPKLKKRRTVSIKSINTEASWQIENEEDIDRYLNSLKARLKKQLEEDTIVNIEF